MANAKFETKQVVVEEVTSKLKESKSTIIVDYRGLERFSSNRTS